MPQEALKINRKLRMGGGQKFRRGGTWRWGNNVWCSVFPPPPPPHKWQPWCWWKDNLYNKAGQRSVNCNCQGSLPLLYQIIFFTLPYHLPMLIHFWIILEYKFWSFNIYNTLSMRLIVNKALSSICWSSPSELDIGSWCQNPHPPQPTHKLPCTWSPRAHVKLDH